MRPTIVVGQAWDLYKTHWRTFVPLALPVTVAIGIVTFALTVFLGSVGAVLTRILEAAGTFWLQGAIVEAVSAVRDRRQDLSVGETFTRIRPRLGSIAAAGLHAALGIGIAAWTVIGIPVAVWLFTIWLLIIPTIVIEGRSARESFGRSRELVRGHEWNVLGLVVITFAVLFAGHVIVVLATTFFEGDEHFIADMISGTVVAPFAAVAWSVAYFALRARESTSTRPAPGDVPT